MRITFVLPEYHSHPIGGYKVVYEYAGFLANAGHRVVVVFPRRSIDPAHLPRFEKLRKRLWKVKTYALNRPLVDWYKIDAKIKIILVGGIDDRLIPDADVIVATAWVTAPPVFALSKSKGVKFYLIQHHEIWDGADDRVNATWRLPMRKIVISKWLMELGSKLGASDMYHITNAIDQEQFKLNGDPHNRPMSILTLYHPKAFKGVEDALIVLEEYHREYPDVPVKMFGAVLRGPEIPSWIKYFYNPSQDFLVNELYNKSAVYLGASRSEGWGLPPAEAMACGCTFVGTDIGGFREFATEGETALLSPVGDLSRMLENLRRITDDKDLRLAIGMRGTLNIQSFTWQKSGSALELLFKNSLTPPELV